MLRSAAVPVLTYHSMRVAGTSHADNDHVAFAGDLERIQRLGLRIVPAWEVARACVEGRLESLRGCIALTMDDGPDFDAYDLPHPAWGPQRGMLGLLRDFRARLWRDSQPDLHATSFVIVSPEARATLDRRHMVGCGWWNDRWWREAEATGLMCIESHSWDHNQETLERTGTAAPRGTFALATREDAEEEIAQATRYLQERRGRPGKVLFAYPFGPASDFLAQEYFPDNSAGHGVFAAFTTDGAPVTRGVNRWTLPRFVCGWHWKSPDELEKLLVDCAALPRHRGFLGRLLGRRTAFRATTTEVASPTATPRWRECLRVWEVGDVNVLAPQLLPKDFGGQPVPDRARHFVLLYSPLPGDVDTLPRVVAYMHHAPHEAIYLCAATSVDADACRAMPKWLLEAVRKEGDLAAILARESIAMLGDSPAAFRHVAEQQARDAQLQAGFVDTDCPHIMAAWRKPLAETEKKRLVDLVDSVGPF